jgi:hypothetical protein
MSVNIGYGENMEDEIKVLNGVRKTLDGLVDIMEGLPDTTENADLWQAIVEASQIAGQITNR